jgi:hypothetical protein
LNACPREGNTVDHRISAVRHPNSNPGGVVLSLAGVYWKAGKETGK